ncbi:MAG: hypothetical protein VKM92_03865 [Cyanobacteriota bacterium]|nr:hypothetical protein [Cyanobacteriota bacterium]
MTLPIRPILPAAVMVLLGGAAVAGGAARADQLAPEAKVRLLFPILTGQELERLLRLAPQAVIVEVQGNSFVEVGRFSDARVAHQLGLTIQRRIQLPFDLAYDQNHPQLGMAMAGQLLPGVPALMAGGRVQVPVAPPAPAAGADPALVISPEALAPAPSAATAGPELQPQPVVGAATGPVARGAVRATATADTPEPEPGRQARIDRLLQQLLSPAPMAEAEPAPAPSAEPPAAVAVSPAPGAGAAALAPTAPIDPAPTDLSEVLRQALQPTPLAGSAVASDKPPVAQNPEPVPPAPASPEVARPEAAHPWLRPVPIAAVQVGVPVSRLQPALNPDLNYLYVQIRQPSDMARLKTILPVQEIALQGEAVLARVGVFTASRLGEVLLADRIERLRAERLEPVLARAGEGLLQRAA